jgi:hypothetical protein
MHCAAEHQEQGGGPGRPRARRTDRRNHHPDTSALIAYLEDEPEAARVAAAVTSGTPLRVSTATVLEAGIVTEA